MHLCTEITPFTTYIDQCNGAEAEPSLAEHGRITTLAKNQLNQPTESQPKSEVKFCF